MRRALSLVILGTALLAMACASGKSAKEQKAEAAPAEAVKPVAVAEPQPGAALPADEVPELPAYPGAIRTKLETSTVPTAEWARKVKVTFEVRDTFENVRDYYLKVIQDYGWEVAGMTQEEDKVGWRLVKGGAVAEVRVEKEGRKRVEVKLERKDR